MFTSLRFQRAIQTISPSRTGRLRRIKDLKKPVMDCDILHEVTHDLEMESSKEEHMMATDWQSCNVIG